MVGASKILTVSYGTFSCTLEGFDEPFNTMKAIAEYFRDLAADDRYFGAEPPQPDAEMLHRIAEREIQRRVEAKVQQNGVILRQTEAGEAAEEPVAPTPVQGLPLAPTPPVAPVQAPEAAAFEVPPSADPVSESVAAKLQRIRAAVASAKSAVQVPEAEVEAEDEEGAGVALDFTAAEVEQEAPQEPEGVVEPAAVAVESAMAEAVLEEAEEEAEREARQAQRAERRALRAARLAEQEAERLAAEAEARRLEEEAAEAEARRLEEEAAEAEARRLAEEAAEAEARRLEEEAAEAEARRLAEEAAEAEARRLEEEAAEAEARRLEEEAAEMERMAEAARLAAEAEEDARRVAEEAALAPIEPPPALRARVIKVRRPDADSAPVIEVEQGQAPVQSAEDDAAIAAAVAAQLAETVDEIPQPAQTGLTPEQEADLLAELAELSLDAEGEVVADETPEVFAEPDPAEVFDPVLASIETSLGAEALAADEEPAVESFADDDYAEDEPELETFEADFEPELAEEDAPAMAEPPAEEAVAALPAEAEVVAQEAGATDQTLAESEDLPAAASSLRLHPAPKPLPEGDVSRLLEQADAQMSVSENRRRFSAIAHLKAAVAATVADRRAGAQAPKPDETVPYREDLSQAVRPRRPVAQSAATARPVALEQRPAPLVLVSEQRVDRSPAEAAAAAVRPRRVSAATLHTHDEFEFVQEDDEPEVPLNAADAASFAEFAESLGSQGLSDLLEAAAAYTAQIEGRPHFSPPQIMRKLTAIGEEGDFSREDRLRVFGTLLRQGKIAKVKRGQYAITEASQYYEKRA